MVDAEELVRLLAGSLLGGRPVDDAGSGALAVRCTPEEVWPAWQAGRSVLDASGRWPVVLTEWDGDPSGPVRISSEVGSENVRGILATAGSVDPWATFGPGWRDQPLGEEWLPILVRDDGLSESEARDWLRRGVTGDGVDRIRLDRRVATSDVPPERIAVSPWFTDRDKLWFVPTGQPCAVVFLDTGRTWEAAAQLDYFGALGADRVAALVAAEREWHERWGAELVASWGTMLQFVVSRRPATVEEAWQLAGQLLVVGESLQLDRSDLALALLQTDSWFLHDRP